MQMPYPTHYLAAPEAPDASLEFLAKLDDPKRWIVKEGVPLFKCHERTDPNTGQLIKVDLPKLHRIAANMRNLENRSGVPIRLTLGHTEPGKPEPEQPPVGGYYRNARVAPFGPKGEPAVVATELLDPQYAPVRKNYPYRSAEYYDDAEQITGVALLTRDPYLDLGVVAYERGDPTFYSGLSEQQKKNCRTIVKEFLETGAASYTAEAVRPTQYNRHTGRKPVLYQLVIGEAPPVCHLQKPLAFEVDSIPTNYGNWRGAVEGAVTGGTLGAKLGSRGGPYGTLAGAVGGAAVGGYHGWHQHHGDESVNNAQYSAPWPGPAYHKHNIGHHHPSGGAIYGNNQYPAGYGVGSTLGGAAGGATLGMMAGGPVEAAVGGLAGGAASAAMDNSRYANCGPGGQMPHPMHSGHHMPEHMQHHGGHHGEYGRGRPPGRYAEEPGMMPGGGGPGGPGGNPLEKVQMLLMAAIEALGEMGGGGGMGPSGPAEAPQAPFPEEDEAVMASRYGRRGGYGRQPRRYGNPQAPVSYGQPTGYAANPNGGPPVPFYGYPQQPPIPYGAVPPTQAPQYPTEPRTISGRPVGQALRESQLQYQLQQQNQAIRMLMYERDQSDTAECTAEIQRLADMGYAVTEYEIGELKAKPRDQRPAYLNHIATHYQKIGTENLPPILGDPTPAGPDPNMNRPATKEEMEAAVRLSSQPGPDGRPINYNQALEQVRYGGAGDPNAGQVNRIANMPYGAPTGPADEYPQYGSFAPSTNGNGRY